MQQFVIGAHKLLHIKKSFTHAAAQVAAAVVANVNRTGSRFHGQSSTHNSNPTRRRREPELRLLLRR